MKTRDFNRRDSWLNRSSWLWLVGCCAVAFGVLLYGASGTARQFIPVASPEVAGTGHVPAGDDAAFIPRASSFAETGRHEEDASVDVGYRDIEKVRVGQRVLANNPEISDLERATWAEPDWHDWRQVHLQMQTADGGILRITMIRPTDWFEQNEAEVGREIFLTLPEMGAEGPARVIDISACPPVESGPGQVVTATFAHPPSTAVLNVRFEGESHAIGVTDNHLFWSVDRQDFAPIGEMAIGERVLTYHGDTKRIAQKLPRPGPQTVYNLEVYGEHVYFVGGRGLLAHNSCAPRVEGVTLTIKEPRILTKSGLSDAERSFLRKHFRIKRNAVNRAARRGELKWSPGTDDVRISELQAAHRDAVSARFERMFGKELDMTRLNADHPVDLVIGGLADQRLRMLNESINKSFGAAFSQAGRKAKLTPGQAISEIVILPR